MRKQRGITQRQLAEEVGVHFTQINRYEAGVSQPTLEVLRGLAKTLRVSADELVFDPAERGPDDEFRVYLEALKMLDKAERKTAKDLLDALLLKHEAKKWASGG